MFWNEKYFEKQPPAHSQTYFKNILYCGGTIVFFLKISFL